MLQSDEVKRTRQRGRLNKTQYDGVRNSTKSVRYTVAEFTGLHENRRIQPDGAIGPH